MASSQNSGAGPSDVDSGVRNLPLPMGNLHLHSLKRDPVSSTKPASPEQLAVLKYWRQTIARETLLLQLYRSRDCETILGFILDRGTRDRAISVQEDKLRLVFEKARRESILHHYDSVHVLPIPQIASLDVGYVRAYIACNPFRHWNVNLLQQVLDRRVMGWQPMVPVSCPETPSEIIVPDGGLRRL